VTLLSPLFLLAIVAVGAPILLHLLRRKEKRTRVFPALRYLKRTTREHAKIVRLRHLLLLVARLAAVVLLVLGGARLVLPIGGRDNPPAGIAIVVDNGLTSGAVVEDARVLDSLVARALEAVGRTGPRDQLWVVEVGSPWQTSTPLAPAGARSEIENLEPSQVPSDLPAALRRAAALLDAAAPELREILVVSDLRPEALESLEPEAARRTETVRIAPPPGRAGLNHGVADLLVSGGLAPRAGDLGEVQVRVAGPDPSGIEVRAYVEDRLIGSVEVGPDGAAALQLPRVPGGWVEGRVEIEPDGLRGDDVAYFAFQSIPAPSVQIVGEVSPYLEEALGVLADAGRIRFAEGGEASVQVITGGAVPALSESAAVLVVPPDDPALLPATNRVLAEVLPGWTLEGSEPGGLEVVDGPILSLLPPLPPVIDPFAVRSEGTEPRLDLLTLSDGRPWAVEVDAAGRSVVILTSALGVEGSELPSSVAMLPLIDVLVSRSVAPEMRGDVRAGDPLALPQGTERVRLPDGTERAVDGARAFGETGAAGVYELLGPGGDVLEMVAVNTRPPEGPGSLSAEEAAARLAAVWEGAVAAEPWPRSVLGERRGREVARPMLAAVLILLLTETWLAAPARRDREKPAPQATTS
jgi:hypothetical protein